MRLRDFVLCLSLGGRTRSRGDFTTARPSSPSFSALGLHRCQVRRELCVMSRQK